MVSIRRRPAAVRRNRIAACARCFLLALCLPASVAFGYLCRLPMNSLLLDFVTALRFFARRRAAFVVIVVTMALALGANTAVFSVLKAFLFSNLAVPEADRVMFVWTVRELPGRGKVDFNDAYPNYQRLRETTHFWEKIACVQFADVNWEQHADTRRLQGARVTTDFFSLMRVTPVLGRAFTEQEPGPNAAPVAVISHALWRSVVGGDPGVLGQTLRLNGAPHTIVGVLPPVFSQPQGTDVWLPFDLPQENVDRARQRPAGAPAARSRVFVTYYLTSTPTLRSSGRRERLRSRCFVACRQALRAVG